MATHYNMMFVCLSLATWVAPFIADWVNVSFVYIWMHGFCYRLSDSWYSRAWWEGARYSCFPPRGSGVRVGHRGTRKTVAAAWHDQGILGTYLYVRHGACNVLGSVRNFVGFGAGLPVWRLCDDRSLALLSCADTGHSCF